MTSSANQWNEVYKLAPWKRKNNTKLTTLRKPDGSLTADIRETLQHMLEYFVPEDKDNDDTDFHTKPERNLENLWTRSTTKTLL